MISIAIGAALVLAASAMAAEEGSTQAPSQADGERLGPVTVRSFEPMQTSPIRLRGRHTPVYFRSPLSEPAASDRDVDRCVPLAAGAAVADWAIFAARVLGFPVEMAIAPPWRTEPLGR